MALALFTFGDGPPQTQEQTPLTGLCLQYSSSDNLPLTTTPPFLVVLLPASRPLSSTPPPLRSMRLCVVLTRSVLPGDTSDVSNFCVFLHRPRSSRPPLQQSPCLTTQTPRRLPVTLLKPKTGVSVLLRKPSHLIVSV